MMSLCTDSWSHGDAAVWDTLHVIIFYFTVSYVVYLIIHFSHLPLCLFYLITYFTESGNYRYVSVMERVAYDQMHENFSSNMNYCMHYNKVFVSRIRQIPVHTPSFN